MLLQALCLLLVLHLAAGTVATLCADRLAELEAIKAQAEGFVGMCDPVCKEDGTYADVQCCGPQCYCATELGEQIMDFSVPLWESEGMTCNCAKEHKRIRDSGLIGRWVNCEQNGDYKPVQCVGSGCHCVNIKTGEKVGNSVHISDTEQLNC